MSRLTLEMQEKIKKFVQKQSAFYLEQTQETSKEKHASLKQITQNDLIQSMEEDINALIHQGSNEQEAFERACAILKLRTASDSTAKWQEKYASYYQNRELAKDEAVGVFYGAFIILGLVTGTLIGFFQHGGIAEFTNHGWIYTFIGLVSGTLVGTAFGMLSHGILVAKNKR